MGVFKSLNGGYEIDFSNAIVRQLKELQNTDKKRFEKLTDYVYERFDWIADFNTNIPVLYSNFESESEAKKRDVTLNRAIHKWFRGECKAKTTEERVAGMLEIERLVSVWFDYVEDIGNECAYTDSMIDQIKKLASEL